MAPGAAKAVAYKLKINTNAVTIAVIRFITKSLLSLYNLTALDGNLSYGP